MLDAYDLFLQHEDKQEKEHQKWLDSLPTCSKCKKKIKDDYLYEIGSELYCENCIDSFRECTDNYCNEE